MCTTMIGDFQVYILLEDARQGGLEAIATGNMFGLGTMTEIVLKTTMDG